MRSRRRAGLGAGALALALAGCAGQEPRLAPERPPGRPTRVELIETPFFPQREYQCGPAALATLLASAGVGVHPDDLLAEVYVPGRRGSLQAEMIAATRSRGLLPYELPPSMEALLAQLDAGQPVLVLQKTGAGPWPGWHYAVVVGYDTQAQRIVLRSGTQLRLEMSAARFLATWDRADRWGLVVLRPGTLPAQADLASYMQAAAGLEAVGQGEVARRAYEVAASHWPGEALPQLGLANLAYARGDLADAERGFRAAIERAPDDAVARNNRAAVLLELGCPAAARREIDGAAALAAGGPHERAVADTRRDIETAAGSEGAGCPPHSTPAHSSP
jgi:tetratricopeptide (TPR) repeat protein